MDRIYRNKPSSEETKEMWQNVVRHMDHVPLDHTSLKALVEELAESDAAQYACPGTSHFALWFYSAEYCICWPSDLNHLPKVVAEYWPQVEKLRLQFYRFQGIPFDQKCCELPEATATLKYALRRLKAKQEEQIV